MNKIDTKLNSNFRSFSQAGQDQFALEINKFKQNGLFVDIGAHHPSHINNTYVMETEFNWDGIAVEIDSSFVDSWKERKCVFLNADAFSVNYANEFDTILRKHNKTEKKFDYLSLDLEPPSLTNKLLHILPLNDYTFNVITYEHDLYRVGDAYKIDAYEFLTKFDYVRVKENVEHGNNAFEDWYVHKSLIN